MEDCRPILEAAEEGKVVIVTSAVTLAEVCYIRRNKKNVRLNSDDEETITAFFENPFIVVRNADRATCEYARRMMYTYDHLKHIDAIHAATAAIANVKIIDTYDPDLMELDGSIHTDTGDPIRISAPTYIGQYRLDL